MIVVDVVGRDGQSGLDDAGLRAELVEPGVRDDGGQRGAALGVHAETLSDQVLAGGRHAVPEPHVRHADLVVRLEGNVPTHHVEQEDAEGPDGSQLTIVPVVSDPLGRGVDPRPVKVRVDSILQLSSGSKVNQLQLESFQVN